MKTKTSKDVLARGVRHAVDAAFTLTPAERAIAGLLPQGMTNKEIGRELGKSDQTVKRQLATLMKRLKVRSRMELAQRISSGEALANPRTAVDSPAHAKSAEQGK
jgi:DNA-binding NarL/FixJ family response regulator